MCEPDLARSVLYTRLTKMFDAKEKSFEYASDSSKLLITLATGIIAFTVTFAKEFEAKPSSRAQAILLLVSWIVLLASAVLGVSTLLAITGELDPPDERKDHVPSIRDPKIKFPLRLQILTFLIGVILIVVYGGLKIFH
jgi:amino acid transporter